MKIKVELDSNETIEQAEDFLEKSLAVKRECGNELYADEYLNDMHTMVCAKHTLLVDQILDEIKEEILKDAHGKNPL